MWNAPQERAASPSSTRAARQSTRRAVSAPYAVARPGTAAMSGSSYWPRSAVYVNGTAPFSRIHATATEVSRPPEKAMPTRSPTGRELSTLDMSTSICTPLHIHATPEWGSWVTFGYGAAMSFRLAAYAVCIDGGRVLIARYVSPEGAAASSSTETAPRNRYLAAEQRRRIVMAHRAEPFMAEPGLLQRL